jgi:hypothetical protein
LENITNDNKTMSNIAITEKTLLTKLSLRDVLTNAELPFPEKDILPENMKSSLKANPLTINKGMDSSMSSLKEEPDV